MSSDKDFDRMFPKDYEPRPSASSSNPGQGKSFIRQPNAPMPKVSPLHGTDRRSKRVKHMMDGTGDSVDSGRVGWQADDQNQVSIMEVGLELMYINGWTGDSVLNSRRVEQQLVELVKQKYRENGWMLNPRRVSVVRDDWGVPVNSSDPDAYIDMAYGKEDSYIRNVLRQLCRYGNGKAGRKFDPAISKKIDPAKPDSWPNFLNVTLDPALRKHATWHPSRWHAGSYSAPDLNTDGLPWHEKLLVPVAWAWSWFLSLTTKMQAVLAIVVLVFLWTLLKIIF
jgi:hypothetical protein